MEGESRVKAGIRGVRDQGKPHNFEQGMMNAEARQMNIEHQMLNGKR
jgi:hypothetical protein